MLRRLFFIFIIVSTLAAAGCKISGTIKTGDGAGVEGVKVYLKGEGEEGIGSIEAITLADGTYTFEGFHHGNLTITPDPDNEEYDFVPPDETVTVNLFANAVINFIAEERETEKDADPSEISDLPWSTFQGNASHTGYVPVYLNPLEFEHIWTWPEPTTEPALINLAAVGTEPVPINPVAAGDGKVFVTTAWESGLNVAIALDSDTGDEKWRYNFGDIDSVNPPAYANNTIYIQSGIGNDSYLWAFNAEQPDSEKVVFDRVPYLNRSFLFYAPTVYEEKVGEEVSVDVYIGGEVSVSVGAGSFWLGGAYSFNFGDTASKEQWRSPLPPVEQWTPAVNKEYVIAYSVPYSYKPYKFDELSVLDRLTGQVVLSIPDEGFVNNTPDYFVMNLAPVLVDDNNVIVIQGGRLISFDLVNEMFGWDTKGETEGAEKGFVGQPSVANGMIYAIYEGVLHARDVHDGTFIWQWPPEPDENGQGNDAVYIDGLFPMLVTDNLIFVSTESTTYAIDLETRTEVWSYDAGGHLALGNDGILFIATAEGELHAISTIDPSIDASLLQ